MSAAKETPESALLSLCKKTPKGVTDPDFKQNFPNFSENERADAINSLLARGRITVFKDGDNIVFRELIGESDQIKFQGLGVEEMLIYQLIQGAGNMGIWTKDLRYRSNLQHTQVTKVLKTLETRKLIKAVKPVASANKKVYMLFNLDPSRELTGGAWYNESEFDSAFIQVLSDQVFQFIKAKGYASVDQIAEFIRTSGISKVELSADEVLSVVGTLIFDGKLEEMRDARAASSSWGGRSQTLYKATRLGTVPNALASVPCGVCPVMNECSDGGIVSPQTCVYFDDWLSF
mmetsp:Transcript_41328/g.67012  ORF Transcript_41328/g.67012 Transcript_41328/m.67012 type:complete len:290 (-) Transcript_41328:628-1497(-)